jgi:GT2 family glycosyltransferase
MNYPFVSVVVLNYNGKRYLSNLFNSLKLTVYPEDKFETIMGDNCSTDGSTEFVEANYPFVKVLRFDSNFGFCKGNNLCARSAKGSYIVFLNTDTVVTSDWLKNLVDAVLNEPGVVVAGSKLLKPFDVRGRKVIDYAGGKITYELNFYEGIYDYDDSKYSVQKYTGFGCGAAVLVEKQFFDSIGGFDEYYFGGGEEVEVGFRAWQFGYKVLFVPSSIVYHYRYATFNIVNDRPTYEWVKSTLYFIAKNYERARVVSYLAEDFLLTLFPKLLVFLFQRKISTFRAVFRGLFDFLLELKKRNLLNRIYNERRAISMKKILHDNEVGNLGVASSFSERMRYRLRSYQSWKSGKY